jgi:nucleoside diphosphate kinase
MLLKPDAIEAGLQEQIEQCAERHGLVVLARRRLRLSALDVETCFYDCACPAEDNPIKFAFCLSYLRRGPVEVWLIAGEAALHRALAVKPIVRDRFGRHEFASVVHTPASVAELEAQIACWFPGLAQDPLARPRPEPTGEPGWRTRLGLDTRRLTVLAAELAALSEAELCGLVRERVPESGSADYVVALKGNSSRRPEEVISTLVRLVPMPLYEAVTAAYASLVLGQTPLVACSAPDAGAIWNALMDEDVLCTVETVHEDRR